jgi:hypothetical protein
MCAPFGDPTVAGVKGLYLSCQRSLVARVTQAEYEEKHERMLARRSVVFADTGAAGFRADVFRAAGGFRADMGAVEDTEFSFRLADLGHRLVVAPDAFVYHRHPADLGHYARRKFRFGRWGAVAYGTFPERILEDSRTPGSMRLQIALVPALLLAALLAPWHGAARLAAKGLGLGYLLSVWPFVGRVWRQDRAVALAAPVVFLVRALAIGLGLAAGLTERQLDRAPAWRAAVRRIRRAIRYP